MCSLWIARENRQKKWTIFNNFFLVKKPTWLDIHRSRAGMRCEDLASRRCFAQTWARYDEGAGALGNRARHRRTGGYDAERGRLGQGRLLLLLTTALRWMLVVTGVDAGVNAVRTPDVLEARLLLLLVVVCLVAAVQRCVIHIK